MLVRGGHRRFDRIIVHVVGPSGLLEFRYLDKAHPDFEYIWKCWNHPNPRPELMMDSATTSGDDDSASSRSSEKPGELRIGDSGLEAVK